MLLATRRLQHRKRRRLVIESPHRSLYSRVAWILAHDIIIAQNEPARSDSDLAMMGRYHLLIITQNAKTTITCDCIVDLTAIDSVPVDALASLLALQYAVIVLLSAPSSPLVIRDRNRWKALIPAGTIA